MSNVVRFGGITTLPIAPDEILENCKGNYERVMVIGVDQHKTMHLHSSEADLIVCNFDLDRAKSWIMREVSLDGE